MNEISEELKNWLGHNKLIARFSSEFFFKSGQAVKFYFYFFIFGFAPRTGWHENLKHQSALAMFILCRPTQN